MEYRVKLPPKLATDNIVLKSVAILRMRFDTLYMNHLSYELSCLIDFFENEEKGSKHDCHFNSFFASGDL